MHAVEFGIINPPPRKNFGGQKISKEHKGDGRNHWKFNEISENDVNTT
jgi:hypothetical protein